MKKSLLLLAASMLVVSCASTGPEAGKVASAEEAKSEKKETRKKNKRCRTGSRLKVC